MSTAEPATSTLVPSNWQVPEAIRRRLGEEAGKQRAIYIDGHLLVVLHSPPKPDTPQREGRFYWRDPEGTWASSGGLWIDQPLGNLLTEFEHAIDLLQQAEDVAKSARDYFDLLNKLNPFVRTTRNMLSALEQARDHVRDDRQLLVWRDRAYSIARAAELLQEDGKNALDFAVAQRAEEEAEASRRVAAASHRLNVLVACFFPVATLAAILGTNMHHGLEDLDSKYAPLPLLAVLGVGLITGICLAKFITRRP
jgi:hypothetical protein